MRKILCVAAGVLAATSLAGCGTAANTAPSQKALVYQGGGWNGDARVFEHCVAESSGRHRYGSGDHVFYYPAGQRTFDFTGEKNADSGVIQVVSRDGVTMGVSGVATFALNTQCDEKTGGVLRQFHERVGLKYAAYQEHGQDDFDDSDQGGGDDLKKDNGWNRMLSIYLKNPLRIAMSQAAASYNWKDLYKNPVVRRQWQADVVELAPQIILAQSGGAFFCGPSYTGKQGEPCGKVTKTGTGKDQVVTCEGCIGLQIDPPLPPDSLLEAQTATQANTEKQAAVAAETQSIATLVKILGQDGYIFYRYQQQVDKAMAEGRPAPPAPVLPGTGVLYPAAAK